jgi:alkanesulfonate monooxygenase SsuD/methylene tetrahydromethanopterin reductase-like flavin-dependent oxidoreductase (luciferase family)
MRDYNLLFEEKIDLFARLLKEKPVTWEGKTRAALDKADVFPKTAGGLKTYVGVGGSPESVIRAARYDFPLMLAIIGGSPDRFVPYVELYRQATEQFGTTAHSIGMHSPGFIADTDEEARAIAWPRVKKNHERIGRTRGWGQLTKEHFNYEIDHGSLYIGSPETVAQKIARSIKVLGVDRFDLVYGAGPMPASARIRMIELYATKVIPRVREILLDTTNESKK